MSKHKLIDMFCYNERKEKIELKNIPAIEFEDGTRAVYPEVVSAYAELEALKSRLTEVDRLLIKYYPCYDETNCKKCTGDWDKIHYETCLGYNVIRALRGEVSGNV